MSNTWTQDQILGLAPDASSAKSGKELSNPRKWVTLGRKDNSVWGLCQGSGSNPYQTQIDLSEPAFHCSCPSRKFPCKHALGLFLIYAAPGQEIPEAAELPDWAKKWVDSRAERSEKRAQKEAERAEAGPAVVDEAARAKRIAQREAKVARGLQELDLWLRDLVRNGLADTSGKPYSYWDGMAARLIDAQAPGLARALREMGGIPSSGSGWQERLLERLGRLYLAIEGYRRIETLPEETQADVRDVIGFTVREEDLLPLPGVSDQWRILGQRVEVEERLKVQRIWLQGKTTGKTALILNFAHGAQPLDPSFVPGATLTADLVFFPGALPMRAIVRTRQGTEMGSEIPVGYARISEAQGAYAGALARFPWLERFPLLLEGVTPGRDGTAWQVRDSEGYLLPIAERFDYGWQLAAISGGRPVTLFGEWESDRFLPVSVWESDRLAASWSQSASA